MSGQLTTSGVVNWDTVLSRTVSFVFGVLVRLQNAGISPVTVEVGRLLCRNIPLEASAQLRITHAISVLTRYGSYGNAIWFGFGIKQVVGDLAESEEGMALVALCAALGSAYEPCFSARVLREFCKLSGAPRDITPTLRQWEMLVKLCTGILSTGDFMNKINAFNLLVFGHSADYRSPKCKPTTYGDLAKAITAIAEVAQRKKANASFLGGLDCAWLAALSEWILCLDVSVVDSNGTECYRSRMRVRDLPQVTILIPERPSKSLLSSQTSIVPPGEWISWLDLDLAENAKGSLHWRSSRSSILRDTFGSTIDALLEVETAQWFALYLESFSMLQRPDPRLFVKSRPSGDTRHSLFTRILEPDNFYYHMDPLLWAQENGKLQQFRRFALQYLPKLTSCLEAAEPVVSQEEAESSALRALESIDAAWPRSLGQNDIHPRMPVKASELVQVISIFLWMMFVTDVEDDVRPSVNGLANLLPWYRNNLTSPGTKAARKFMSLRVTDMAEIDWLNLVFYCFSGLSDEGHPGYSKGSATNRMLARAGGGICVYYRALENPDIPPGSMVKLHVVRGYITYEGSTFDGIRDIPVNYHGQEGVLRGEELPDHSTDFTLDMMIQELSSASQLGASFHVRYLGVDGQSRSLWLRLDDLFQRMQRTLKPRGCRGNCDPLYALKTSPHALCSWRDSSQDAPNINKEKIVEVQEAVESLKDTSTIWLLTTMIRVRSPSHDPSMTTTYFGRPFFLYIIMSQDDPSLLLSLSPFVKCLSCIVELGSWAPICGIDRSFYSPEKPPGMDNGGVVKLIVPDGSKLEITWEDSAQEKQRRQEREQEEAAQDSSNGSNEELYEDSDSNAYESDDSGAS
ncbi:hypothetical protein IMSHALPRED_007588 [Imshaugia aleurites]|uniref:Uncharacterized protein n=1 Tax=Imshaugia aleurites TaxID=172621 RepID=A0A8H3ID05_9LECA|nr:hypothetical protein IMSHALPRED_007588 [Imshaugia aleurites]